MVTRTALDACLGHRIDDICPNGYADASDNHCAHFVSHVCGLRFGLTCDRMVPARNLARRGSGGPPLRHQANIRVQEVFQRCPEVGAWNSKPIVLVSCLIFITHAANVNVQNRTMVNVPRKHVGIYLDNLVWHYSNTRDQVVNQTVEEFSNHYPSPYNALFYGKLPWVMQLSE